MSEHDKSNRRDFLSIAGIAAAAGAAGTALAGMARLPKPAVLPGPSQVFRLGEPAQFAVGSATRMEAERFILFRDERGFHAISSVCTHLGCIVAQSESGFECPCHGSRFAGDGTVTGGPAPTGLAWLEVSLSPDGQLQVDTETEVPRGAKLAV
jgi:cytochrome b6-f complex iron-sulfur subunit